MRFSLASTLLVLICCSLLFGWYSERSRYKSAESKWQAARVNLIEAAMLLGERNAKIDREDEDLHGFVDPTVEYPSDEELNRQYAAESLILVVNIEDDMHDVLRLYLTDDAETEDTFKYIADEYWCLAGKPTFDQIKIMAKQSDWNISIKRPQALKNWIQKFEQRFKN